MSLLIPLRVLILEDRAQDAELVLDELRQAGFAPDWQRVETEQDFLAHLSADLDLILADYALPRFDGVHALRLVQERALDIPFILVTGTIGEERAVAIMKTGATDYILKDRLARLGEAVKRALQDKRLRDEKEQAGRALRASEIRYRRLFETAKDGVLLLDADSGLIQDINPYLLSLLGHTYEDLLGKQLWEIGLFKDIEASKAAFKELEQTGYIRYEDLPLVTRDGRAIAVQFVSNVYEADGQKVIQCNIRDITDRKKAESTSRLLASIVESSADAIIGKTVDGTIMSWNKGAEHIYGYRAEEAIGGPIDILVPPEQRHEFALIMTRVKRGEHIENFDTVRRRKDGTQVDVSLTISPLKDDRGNTIGASTIARDISERKQAEATLHRSQAAEHEQRVLAETLRDTAAILTSTLDPETVMNQIMDNVGRVVPHDAAAIKLIDGDFARVAYARGWTPDDAVTLGDARLPLSNPVIHTGLTSGRALFIADTRSYPGWVNLIPRLCSYASAPIRIHGKVIGFLDVDSVTPGFFTARHAEQLQAFADQAGVALENAQLYAELQLNAVELQQRVEERTAELNRVKEHAEAILNNSSDGILVVRVDGTISQVNPAAEALFGYSTDALVDRPWTMFLETAQAEQLAQAIASLWTSQQAAQVEIEAYRKDGTTFLADFGIARVTLQKADTGIAESVEFVCNIRDITARKRAEAELRRSLEQQKELVALKSHFISMASHDFRTPLTVILTSCELLKLELTRSPRENMPEILEKRLARIRDAIRHMTELIDDVLMINVIDSGHLKLKMETLDLRGFCQDILDEIGPATGLQNALAFTLEGSRTTFVADRHLFRQVLVNLLTNAIKYSPEGGNVYLNVQGDAEQVIFKVRDEGIGIPEKDQPRLFEIFYRASNVGNISGTGLGLAIMKRNVEALGGTIGVQSREGAGTTFTVSIPVKTIP